MTHSSQALVYRFIPIDKLSVSVLVVFWGCASLTLLAQMTIPLPFTPVPVTGQTFGVLLLSLLFGFRLGLASVGLYLFGGLAGLPIFAMGKSGVLLGPTTGYLIGMFFAAALIGSLADRGWAKSFWKAFLACVAGSVLIYALGVFVLSFFLPSESLWMAGIAPFIVGDLIKSFVAASISYVTSRRLEASYRYQ